MAPQGAPNYDDIDGENKEIMAPGGGPDFSETFSKDAGETFSKDAGVFLLFWYMVYGINYNTII